jgi:hypothetical protein
MYSRRGPEGVPNPYEPAIEIYPNYVHGSDYTRPYFGEPYLVQPYNVLEGLGVETDIVAAEAKYNAMKRGALVAGTAASAGLLGLLAVVGAPAGMRVKAAVGGVVIGALCGGLSAFLVFGQMEA